MSHSQHPSILRRLAAMLYDSILILAMMLISTAIIVAIIPDHVIAPGNRWYQAWLLLIMFGFFAWFWTHGGQTLGMLAWRIQIKTADGAKPRLKDAAIRFCLAVPSLLFAGIGLLWQLIDKDRLALYDRFSNTQLVILPKEQR